MSPDCLSKMDEERERIAQADPDPLQTVLAAHLAAAFRRGATFDHAVETFLEVCGDGTPDAEVWRLARMWAQGREAVSVEIHEAVRVSSCNDCPMTFNVGEGEKCGLLWSPGYSAPMVPDDGAVAPFCPLRSRARLFVLAEGV